MHDISYRLKLIMGDLSVRKFAERLEMPATTIQEYLKGRMPPADFIVRVCERFHVDCWQLLTGKEKTVAADPSPVYEKAIYANKKERVLADRLARIIREGDPKKIKAVVAQLEAFDPKPEQPPFTRSQILANPQKVDDIEEWEW